MSVSKRSDLLPIDDENSNPNPYQVFGLQQGETDLRRIGSQVKATIDRLKSVRKDVDSDLWKEVATLVQNSRATLADPKKKAALDSGLQNRSPATPAVADPVPVNPAPVDPLASLLPPVNPMANKPKPSPSSPTGGAQTNFDTSPASNAIPSGLFDGPAVDEDGSPIIRGEASTATASTAAGSTSTTEHVQPVAVTPASDPPVAAPQLRNTKPRNVRRRRKSMFGPLIMGLITLTLMAMVAGLGYFLFFGSGTLSISSTGEGVTISTSKPPEDQSPVVSPPVELEEDSPEEKKRVLDPVMGTLSDVEPPPIVRDSQIEPVDGTATQTDMDAGVATNNAMTAPDTDGNADAPETSMRATPPEELTPEVIEATQKSIDGLRQFVRDRRWSSIKPMSETMMERPMTPEQQPVAEGLYQLVDLATYYRSGIQQGIESLNTGDDFAVTDDFRVIIVERNENSLTVRYNAKNRTYSIDEMPLPLANRLATFAIPEGPLRDASKSVYQSLVANATPEHQTEAVNTLRSLPDGAVEGVQLGKLIASLQSVTEAPTE